MKKLSLLCAVLLLSACGSGSNSTSFPPPLTPAPPPPPPAAVVDAFFSTVSQYFNPTGEDTDATPLADSIVGTQPEDTEPSEFT